ncbi:hypothetical protein [Candidatus Litorirhabdus singularis]|nr:hypothetical protein [Candidatus Litorirhabdus singularis]
MFTAVPAAQALCEFARTMLEDAFAPHDPRTAQHEMPVEEFASALAELKPAFIHHPTAKEMIRKLLADRGCDLGKTYFDVPRLRSSTSDGYLTSGIAYAFHPHRDTWYSAPSCQINWWLPVYPVPAGAGMEIYPRYWDRAVANTSSSYNYARWTRESRFNASQHLKNDTRQQPRAKEPLQLDGGVMLNGEPGALTVFSAAQLHASAKNVSGQCRFSIDFRTVHLDDLIAGNGAPNIDSKCSGTTLGDYLCADDLAHIPGDLIQSYDIAET